LRQPAVAVWDERAEYGAAPFPPDRTYPEWERGSGGGAGAGSSDGVPATRAAYDLVRSSLACYDAERFGTADWNPLAELIEPGQSVVVKPNLVIHERLGFTDLVTHAAVVRCLLDYACLALRGSGRITVCDAPIQGADFGRLVRESGLDRVLDCCNRGPGLTLSLVDLRSEWARIDDGSGYIQERVPLPGDPEGSTLFDVGASSALEPIVSPVSRVAVGDYDAATTSDNHAPGRHRYRVSNTVLDADVVLNVAKMKTHQKAGVTGALKNVVGMTTHKEFLPHFRMGGPPAGDEFPASAYNVLVARGKGVLQEYVPLGLWRIVRRWAEAVQGRLRRRPGGDARYGLLGGGWQGNDTVWRMVVDLNDIVRRGDRDGRLHAEPRRRLYHFVDGIVAGEGDGPLRSLSRRTGLFLHGADAVAVDALMAALMGFDPDGVPLIRGAFGCRQSGLTTFPDLGEVPVLLDRGLRERCARGAHFAFRPPRGWPRLASSVPVPLLARLARRSAAATFPPPFGERGTR
jgi:uncharacterized protein (DUF362 family)